jgi:hypothetical protein
MRVVLGNIDYRLHTTDEGEQLQAGLALHGWVMSGRGYDDVLDCSEMLARYAPEMVFVQDKRDWDPQSGGAFRKDLGFVNLEALAARPDVFKICPVKDAGTSVPYQHQFCKEVGADVVLTYYHDKSVDLCSGFLGRYKKLRVYHSVDSELIRSMNLLGPRARAVVSGATSHVIYPLRERAFRQSAELGVYRHGHPGYGNRGNNTPNYLGVIAGFKVHLATASKFGFALRKIIESVAVGCTPVTDLPAYDVLPEIDGALVRVDPKIGNRALRAVIDRAERLWRLEERMEWSRKALEFYDWKAQGRRTADALERLHAEFRRDRSQARGV